MQGAEDLFLLSRADFQECPAVLVLRNLLDRLQANRNASRSGGMSSYR